MLFVRASTTSCRGQGGFHNAPREVTEAVSPTASDHTGKTNVFVVESQRGMSAVEGRNIFVQTRGRYLAELQLDGGKESNLQKYNTQLELML